jgi:hypothetical protein
VSLSLPRVMLAVALLCFSVTANGQTPNSGEALPPASGHRAVKITPSAEAVLRDDGRVVAFRDLTGSEPVFVEGLTDIVDIAGTTAGLGPVRQRGSANWIALGRNGTVFQWEGACAEGGLYNCRYTRPKLVPSLRDIVAIASNLGSHLALDRQGRVWVWGWYTDRSITGPVIEYAKKSRVIKTPVSITFPLPLKWIGSDHFPAGIDHQGNVWIWSSRSIQQLRPIDIVVGERAFEKVTGIPPARSVTTSKPVYVVTEEGQLWSWDEDNRVSQQIERFCRVRSVSGGGAFAGHMVVAVCEDGSLYRMYERGASKRDGCNHCPRSAAEEEKWEKLESVKNVAVLHLGSYLSNAALIDRLGTAFSTLPPVTLFEGELYSKDLKAKHRNSAPLNLDPKRSK